jgi:hypothetical protein
MTAMRERRRSRVLRLRGVDMGFAVYEMEKERITESSYSNSRRGVEAWQLGVEFAAEGNTGRGM